VEALSGESQDHVCIFSPVNAYLYLPSLKNTFPSHHAVLQHEYDGWQIATYVWPRQGKGGHLDPTKQNDDRLRLVSYQFLWMFQAMGMGMSSFAITQAAVGAAWPSLPGAFWPVLGAGLIVGWFTFSKWVPSKYFKSPLGPHPVLFTPKATMAVFITAAAAFLVNVAFLLGKHWLWGVLAVVCFIMGGFSEAFGAEGSLKQGYHVAAVVIISTGAVLLMAGLQSAAGLVMGTDMRPLLPWLVPSVQLWLGVLALAGLAMLRAARFVSEAAPPIPGKGNNGVASWRCR
jgi:hypothetical protein